MKITEKDLTKLIRDVVGEEFAERREESIEIGTKKAEAIARGENPEQAQADRLRGGRQRLMEAYTGEKEGSKFGVYINALICAGGHQRTAEAARIAAYWGEEEVADMLSDTEIGKTPQGAVPKQLQATVFGSGGAIVPEVLSAEFIEYLRDVNRVRMMGARSIPMEATSLDLGRQNATATASYIGEGVNIPKSQLGTDQVKLVGKKLVALTPVSNDLARRAAFSAQQITRDDLVGTASNRSDLAFIRGDGTQDTPKGIRNLVDSGNVFAQSGTAVTDVVPDLAKMARLVQESKIPFRRPGWMFTSRTQWFLFSLLDANNNFIFRREMEGGSIYGFPFGHTDQIPNTLGGGSNESEIYFAEFTDLVIGELLGMQVEIFPGGAYHDGSAVVSGISTDETVVRLITEHDFNMRHTNTAAVMTGVTYGA